MDGFVNRFRLLNMPECVLEYRMLQLQACHVVDYKSHTIVTTIDIIYMLVRIYFKTYKIRGINQQIRFLKKSENNCT